MKKYILQTAIICATTFATACGSNNTGENSTTSTTTATSENGEKKNEQIMQGHFILGHLYK